MSSPRLNIAALLALGGDVDCRWQRYCRARRILTRLMRGSCNDRRRAIWCGKDQAFRMTRSKTRGRAGAIGLDAFETGVDGASAEVRAVERHTVPPGTRCTVSPAHHLRREQHAAHTAEHYQAITFSFIYHHYCQCREQQRPRPHMRQFRAPQCYHTPSHHHQLAVVRS